MTRVEEEILNQVKALQPVSVPRLGLGSRRQRIFNRLVQQGAIVPAGRGMLGTNWMAK